MDTCNEVPITHNSVVRRYSLSVTRRPSVQKLNSIRSTGSLEIVDNCQV